MANGVGAALIVMERTFWTDSPFESVNLNWVFLMGVVVGVPEIFPVAEFNVSPFGNNGDPGTRVQV